MNQEIVLYWHAGSGNHGCEAIVRGTTKILANYKFKIFSMKPKEDEKYINDYNIKFVLDKNNLYRFSVRHWIYAISSRITKNQNRRLEWIFKPILDNKEKIMLSIGGDIYCSDGGAEILGFLNERLSKGNKTILWGCSIEPDILIRDDVVMDMLGYSAVLARESITYEAIKKKCPKANLYLFPDPAFVLDAIHADCFWDWDWENTIGLNASPLILNRTENKALLIENYYMLIDYILENQKYKIALIPHVVWDENNDNDILNMLYLKYKDTNRVILVEDSDCRVLKGYISKCKIVITARTHMSIAAYSTCVPTLVTGYSVKSKGIAKDLFGDYENYVVSVKDIRSKYDLVDSFKWIEINYEKIKKRLVDIMPNYIERAYSAADVINRIEEQDE